MHDIAKLEVHGDALDLAVSIYEATDRFPRREVFGLSAQIRRSAVSVSSNIAEGAGRESNRDFSRFVRMAEGSLSDLRSQTDLASRLGFLDDGDRERLARSIRELGLRLRRLRAWLERPSA